MEDVELWQGNCLELMKDIPDKSVDLVITDPPYLHVKGGMKSKEYNTGTWKADSNMVVAMSDFGEAEIFNFLDAVMPKMKKVNMYIFCSKLQLVSYFKYISTNKKLKYDLLVWDKVKYTMKSSKFYTSDIEYVVRIYQAGVSLRKVLTEDGTKSDITHYMKRQAHPQPRGEHGTMKPVNLIENFIRVASDECDVVLDPFMGSGTTGVACKNLNRNFIGIELDENYFEIAKNRILETNMED